MLQRPPINLELIQRLSFKRGELILGRGSNLINRFLFRSLFQCSRDSLLGNGTGTGWTTRAGNFDQSFNSVGALFENESRDLARLRKNHTASKCRRRNSLLIYSNFRFPPKYQNPNQNGSVRLAATLGCIAGLYRRASCIPQLA